MGYSIVACDRPKHSVNFAGVMRAAQCYKSKLIVLGGSRFKNHSANVGNAEKQIPLIRTLDVFSVLPFNCVPIAVELLPNSIPLWNYNHPQQAFYIFGPEDSSLGKRITQKCRDVIYVPMEQCMNLAACVNVVLYDRLSKEKRKELIAC